MKLIYENLARGATPPVAVREAQLCAMQTPHLSHMFYWAGFSVGGVGTAPDVHPVASFVQ
jgi:CHAT domain-containing protein